MRLYAVIFIFLISVLCTSSASAQSPTPAIAITCQPAQIDIPVYPGANATGMTTCTATNPTSYEEKVAISVTSDGLRVESIGDLIVPANSESDFDVTVSAPEGHEFLAVQPRALTVQGTVQEINGNPPQNVATSGASCIVNLMQYVNFSITENNSLRQVTFLKNQDSVTLVKSTVNLELSNGGNGMDNILFGVDDISRNLLESEGFQIEIPLGKIPVDPFESSKFNFSISLTKDIDYSTWTVLDNGSKFLKRNITIYANSDFECKNGGCNEQSVTIELEFYLEEKEDSNFTTYLIIGVISFIILTTLLVVIMKESKTSGKTFHDAGVVSQIHYEYSTNPEYNVKTIPVINLKPPINASGVQDENGYEWVMSEDGKNWYRVYGTTDEWTEFSN
ncbi:MAG: choice-of-anchor T family protein [Candidatus Poseidoniaceae archaeon]